MTVPKQLIEDLEKDGAFQGYTIPDEALENHYEESIHASNGTIELIYRIAALKTTDPYTVALLLTTDGCGEVCGKEMLNLLPVRFDRDDTRDRSTDEYQIDLGENVILHMIQGMIDRQKHSPEPVTHAFIGLMISTMFVVDEEGELVQSDNGRIALSEGGLLFSRLIGRGVVECWGDFNDPC